MTSGNFPFSAKGAFNDFQDFMEPRSYELSVLPQWIDFTGRCRFSTTVSNILDVAGMDARRNGFGIDVLGPRGIGWVLSRLCVELDSRPMVNEPYTVVTWVKGYTPLLSTRCFEFRDAEGRCFGRAVSIWCLINFADRRPVPMETIMETASKSVTPKDEPCPGPKKIRPFDAPAADTHRVKYTDIDFNRHMNTLRYVDLVVDELPPEVSSSAAPMRVDIHFVKESVYGDKLNVYCVKDGSDVEKSGGSGNGESGGDEPDTETGGGSGKGGNSETWRTAIRKEDGTLVLLADFREGVSENLAR